MAPLEITLNGTGTVMHTAERAILSLQAHSEHVSNPSEATQAVTVTANALRDILILHCPQDEATGKTLPDAAIAHYSMSPLDTTSHSRRTRDNVTQLEPQYSARADFKIKFQDFGVLNNLATRFSAMKNVKIAKIEWALTDDTANGIRGGARKRAAQDAIQRAYDYAEVFAGVSAAEAKKKVKPLSVNENHYYQMSTRPQLHYGKGQRGTRSGREELQFEPEDVRLDVTITAKFAVEIDD
jgi:uncharacterized protein YggE